MLLQPGANSQIPNVPNGTFFSTKITREALAKHGSSVAISGDYLVVGEPEAKAGGNGFAPHQFVGAVTVYSATSGEVLHTISSPVQAGSTFFGSALSMEGSLLVVGSSTFGASVDISGPRIIVGAPRVEQHQGRAYVYDLTSPAPAVPVFVLSKAEAQFQDSFGASVAIEGTRAVVGVPGDDIGTFNGGAVYVFNLASETPLSPTVLQEPSDGTQNGFGSGSTLRDGRLIVSSSRKLAGLAEKEVAYVYDLQGAGPWTPKHRLAHPEFGIGPSISVSGSRVAIGGAPSTFERVNRDMVCIFHLEPDAAEELLPALTVEPPTNPTGRFGAAVALQGSSLLVGAPWAIVGGTQTGAAFLHNLENDDPSDPVHALTETSQAVADHFGRGSAASGKYLAIAAPGENSDKDDTGSVYIFDVSSATPMVPVHVLRHPDPARSSKFGEIVAISGSRVAVGCPVTAYPPDSSGMVYVFDLESGAPDQPVLTVPNPAPNQWDNFGFAIALSGDRLLVGADGDDLGRTDAGVAYLYNLADEAPNASFVLLANPEPTLNTRFGIAVAASDRILAIAAGRRVYVYDAESAASTAPFLTLASASSTDSFGRTLAAFGSRVLVGAPDDSTSASLAGRAYLYDVFGPAPAQPVTLQRSNAVAGEHFGRSLAMWGNRVAIGCGFSGGKVWIYDRTAAAPNLPVATLENPTPQSGDVFGAALAITTTELVVTDPFDNTLAGDKGAAYRYSLPDNYTERPVLLSPASGVLLKSPVTVQFSLPENAAAGEVSVSFLGAQGTSKLRLGSIFTMAGLHSISINTLDLAGSPGVISVEGIASLADGSYAVSVACRDAAGNAVNTSAVVAGVVIDATPPVIANRAAIHVETASVSGAVVEYPAAEVTDAIGVASVSYSHPSGASFPLGTSTVTVTATDTAGNQSQNWFEISVRLSAPVHEVLSTSGTFVPNPGGDPQIPAGATWASFGAPTLSDSGEVAFSGKWTSTNPKATGAGIFRNGELTHAVRDNVGSGSIKSLATPLFSRMSDTLLGRATLMGTGVTARNDDVFVTLQSPIGAIWQEGTPWPPAQGVRIASITAYAARDSRCLVLAKLSGRGVNGTNNRAAYIYEDGIVTPVARTGQDILGRKVKHLRLLAPVPGSPGHGRNELLTGGVRFIAAFTDKTEAIVEWSAPDTFVLRALTGSSVEAPGLPGAEWKSVGFAVSSADDDESIAFAANLKAGVGDVVGTKPRGVFRANDDAMHLVAELDGGVPDRADVVFTELNDPVLAPDGTVMAFGARMRIAGKTVPAIAEQAQDDSLRIVTTLIESPPGAPSGARWKAFKSLAAPGGGLGVLFTASLQVGAGGITARSDQGIWAVDSFGSLRCIVREADVLDGKELASFRILSAESATPGVTREFNGNREIVWVAKFTDGTSGIVKSTIP